MVRHDGGKGDRGARSICLVPSDLNYLYRNGGIGTYFWSMAHLLAGHGWRVHILYCGPVDDPQALVEVPRRLAEAGIHFSHMEQFSPPPAHRVAPYSPAWYAQLSDRVRYALEELDGVHHFDLIEFGDLNCYGFRTVQARRAGTAFANARLLVKLHGTSQWLREGNYLPVQRPDDLRLDFCERYAFEHADVQVSPCRYMLDYVRGCGWNVRPDAHVISYPFLPARTARPPRNDGPPEVVFFGRLETRKGLEIFLEAAGHLDPEVPIAFIGRDTTLGDGTVASELVRSRLTGRAVSLHMCFNQEQAVGYLLGRNRMAVIASLMDNFPNTVIECATNGIPFIATRVGGIPEILDDRRLQDRLLFRPDADDLARCLRDYLGSTPAERREWCERARQVTDVDANNRRVADLYEQLFREAITDAPLPAAVGPAGSRARVTVSVTFRDHAAPLPDVLTSLAAQAGADIQVLVVDDGSTSPAALRTLEGQRRRYPNFQFRQQLQSDPGLARNRALAEAVGDFFLAIDADTRCEPLTVSRLVDALGRRPELAAVTCYRTIARRATDDEAEDYIDADRPTGGPHVLAVLENVYGSVALFRTADLRAVGGFEPNEYAGAQSWDVFVKLAIAGRGIDVVPEYLCHALCPAAVATPPRPRRRCPAAFAHLDALSPAEKTCLLELLVSAQHRCHDLDGQVVSLKLIHQALCQQVGQLDEVNRRLHDEVIQLRAHAENVQHHLAHHRHHAGELERQNEDLTRRLLTLRYRVADRLNRHLKRVPLFQGTVKGSIFFTWKAWKGMRGAPGTMRRLLMGGRRNAA